MSLKRGEAKSAWQRARKYRVLLLSIAVGALLSSRMVAAADRQWTTVGGDAGNTRYSPVEQINSRTVKSLGAAWTKKLNAGGTSSAPVVVEGRLFVTAGASIYAIDAESGRTLWSYEPSGTPTWKGVAVGGGRVYVGLSNADLIALDQRTGKLLWTHSVGDADWKGVELGTPPPSTVRRPPPLHDNRAVGQSISAAPAYVDEKVIVGLANGDFGIRGRVACVDAATGKRLWQFFTVPAPGEMGSETWPRNSEVWKTGGGGVWMNPAIDADLGLVYLGVGNPVPQLGGEVRPGDNLFTNSVVALDIRTGKLAWHFQAVRHDLWDHDLGTPLILFEAQVQGRKRRGLAVMRTDGYLFQLDRESGKPLLPIVDRPVPHNSKLRMSPTQPFPVGAEGIGPRCVEPSLAPPGFQLRCYYDELNQEPNLLFPFSTTRAAPMSFSPKTGYFYATAGIEPRWLRRGEDPYYQGYIGLGEVTAGIKHYGLIAAVDGRTGRLAWQRRLPYRASAGSGVMSTAGGLLLHGGTDGRLQAYDATSGKSLWSFQTGAPIRGPVSTYEVRGQQFIAVGAGELWAFKLGGNVPPRTAPTPPSTETKFVGPRVRIDSIEIGAMAFDVGTTGPHAIFDEYALHPVRVRVGKGATVTWVNKGSETHSIRSRDGTWETGSIAPGQSRSLTLSKPGHYIYACTEHPWSSAELTVSEVAVNPQAERGGKLYSTHCSACHGANLGGREPAPALAGSAFVSEWLGRAVGTLHEAIRDSMPLGRPNSLSPQEYLDVVEFLLDTNDVASDGSELRAGSSRLQTQIQISVQ